MAAAARRWIEAALLRSWERRGAVACSLWPLSLLARAVLALRCAGYRWGLLAPGHVAVPVVVVGNVVAGGAGKTPVAMALVRHLQARGLAVGVLSRGHGRHIASAAVDCRAVRADDTADVVGDEPLLIHRSTGVPVYVARRRLDAARGLLAAHPHTQVLVCDDGLQHARLARDIEICVFDDRGLGNGFMLPAGPLREPWPRRRCTRGRAPVELLLHSGSQPAFAGDRAQRSLAAWAVRADGSRHALAAWHGQRVAAVAAIARPEAFFAMLRAAGLHLVATQALPDHDAFTGWAPADPSLALLCTEKDAVKLWPRHPGAWAVPLQVDLDAAFLRRFDAALHARLSSSDGHQTA